jgi:molybdopterin converting factor small subunit
MKIQFYGNLAASLGRELELDLPGTQTVADVRRALTHLRPASAADLAATRARACVNDAMSPEDRPVAATDEIAFLPPLSGG